MRHRGHDLGQFNDLLDVLRREVLAVARAMERHGAQRLLVVDDRDDQQPPVVPEVLFVGMREGALGDVIDMYAFLGLGRAAQEARPQRLPQPAQCRRVRAVGIRPDHQAHGGLGGFVEGHGAGVAGHAVTQEFGAQAQQVLELDDAHERPGHARRHGHVLHLAGHALAREHEVVAGDLEFLVQLRLPGLELRVRLGQAYEPLLQLVLRPAVADGAADGARKFVQVERFPDEVGEADPHRLDAGIERGVTRDGHEGQVSVQRPRLLRERQAAERRHRQVGDEAVERLFAQTGQRPLRIRFLHHLQRRVDVAQRIGHERRDLGLVIHHEHPRRRVGPKDFRTRCRHVRHPFPPCLPANSDKGGRRHAVARRTAPIVVKPR
jgi:hypothetical protein